MPTCTKWTFFGRGRGMNEVAAIVEGLTEKAFVRDVLAAHLEVHGVRVWADLPGRAEHSGGVRKWESVRKKILHAMRGRRGRVCTTMFDYYGLAADWPGRAEARQLPPDQRGDHVEQAMIDDLAAHAGEDFRTELFIPYVQMHEFEALLFADVAALAAVLSAAAQQDRRRLADRFRSVVDEAGSPEAIDDGWETCPSRRITRVSPRYAKPTFGPLIANRIGLETIRAACPHFGQWLARLEALGAGGIRA